jgi:hypothetical protein
MGEVTESILTKAFYEIILYLLNNLDPHKQRRIPYMNVEAS